jgi:hypothetical protein
MSNFQRLGRFQPNKIINLKHHLGKRNKSVDIPKIPKIGPNIRIHKKVDQLQFFNIEINLKFKGTHPKLQKNFGPVKSYQKIEIINSSGPIFEKYLG